MSEVHVGTIIVHNGVGISLSRPELLVLETRTLGDIDVSDAAPTQLLRFGARFPRFSFRDKEIAALRGFLALERPFSWWIISGPAGMGKSRLALELVVELVDWDCGFVTADSLERTDWSRWTPSRPTLVVVDYVRRQVTDVQRLLQNACKRSFAHVVRVLLLERSSKGEWWSLLRDAPSSDLAALDAALYQSESLELRPLDATAYAALVSAAHYQRNGTPFHEANVPNGASASATPLLASIRALLADASTDKSTPISLVGELWDRERARWGRLVPDSEIDLYEDVMAVATLAEGMNLKTQEAHMAFSGWPSVNAGLLLELSNSRSLEFVEALQPDLLGEFFVLRHLNRKNALSARHAGQVVSSAWRAFPRATAHTLSRISEDFGPSSTILECIAGLMPMPDAHVYWMVLCELIAKHLLERDRSAEARSVQNGMRRAVDDPAMADSDKVHYFHVLDELIAHSNDKRTLALEAFQEAFEIVSHESSELLKATVARTFLKLDDSAQPSSAELLRLFDTMYPACNLPDDEAAAVICLMLATAAISKMKPRRALRLFQQAERMSGKAAAGSLMVHGACDFAEGLGMRLLDEQGLWTKFSGSRGVRGATRMLSFVREERKRGGVEGVRRNELRLGVALLQAMGKRAAPIVESERLADELFECIHSAELSEDERRVALNQYYLSVCGVCMMADRHERLADAIRRGLAIEMPAGMNAHYDLYLVAFALACRGLMRRQRRSDAMSLFSAVAERCAGTEVMENAQIEIVKCVGDLVASSPFDDAMRMYRELKQLASAWNGLSVVRGLFTVAAGLVPAHLNLARQDMTVPFAETFEELMGDLARWGAMFPEGTREHMLGVHFAANVMAARDRDADT